MPIRRKTPVPMTAAELAILDTLEDELLDWIDAGKGPFVANRADYPGTPDVVWSEFARCARNAGWNVIASDTLLVVDAVDAENR